MKNLTFNVPDMQSAHCQARVRVAINAIDDVTIQNLKAGSVAVSIEDESLENEILAAIEKAGYTVEN